jgi:hypothetical protein
MKNKKYIKLLILLLFIPLTACTVDEVLDDIDVGIQIASNIGLAIGNVSSADEASIQAISAQATAGLNLIQQTYNQYQIADPQTLSQKVNEVATLFEQNFKQSLSLVHVSNSSTQQKVQSWANLLIGSVNAVIAALPLFKSNTIISPVAEYNDGFLWAVGNKTHGFNVPLTATQLQKRWTKEVCNNETKCSKLVHVPRHGMSRALHFGKK